VLNVSKILYRDCARSKNHVQKRSIFAVCSPMGPDRDHYCHQGKPLAVILIILSLVAALIARYPFAVAARSLS
jgi:hypothetical protein